MPIGNPIGRTNNVASRIITVEATSAQTLFTVQGGYRVNAISVYRNGVRLANDNDYTASDGSTVLLNLAANTGDTLTFHIFDDFKVADAIVSAASTQTVYGNLAVTGSIYANNFNEGVGEFVHDSNDNVYTQSLTTLTDLTTGSDNFVVGAGASEITTGSNNNFIGNDAGRCTTTGAYNNFFGANAGLANTSGTSNNFLGLNAGRKNSVGSNNTFLGQDAGCCNTSGRNNVFLGASAGRSNTTGSNNFFVGNSAGLENTTGCNNVSIGQSAGKSTTTGCGNVFLGMEAGCLNTTGEFNNFLGFKAGIGNTTGKRNNFLGVNAGRCNTSGSYNNFFGGNAGLTNSTGNSNTFIGRSAGCSNTTGGCNTFIGENSGRVNTTGNSNNFLGLNAGFSNTTGANNIFVGSCAGYSNTSGDANVFLGGNAGKCNSTGKWNFAVSSFALNNNVSGCYNVAIGRRAGVGYTGSNGIFIGAEAGRCSADGEHNIHLGFYAGCCTTGCHNNFLGEQAGRNSTTGAYNNFFGRYTGCSNTTGGHNTFMGRKAGCSNTTGGCNTFIGENAGRFNQTGVLNTFIGRNAGCCATGSYNHFFGNGAGQMTTSGEKNVFIGPLAGQYNTVGCNNIFFGHCAGRSNTVGSFNNFSGQAAGCNNISGCYNNFFGNQAGFANTTGSNNNFLGRIAGCSITTGSNNFIVGNIAGTSALSDTIILGTNTTERLRIDSSGRVGIGTINPQEDLHIGSNSPYILLEDYDNSRKWRIKGTAFFAIEDNTAGEDRLLIDSSGQVGIGTNSPDSLLHLSTTSAEIVQTFETSTGTVKLYANNDDFVFDADKYRFRSEDGLTEYVRIDSDGRLGVGTISMSALIHARTASAGANMFMLEADLGTNNDRTFYITAPATDSGSDPFTFKTGNSIDFEVDSVSRLRIDSSGRVGIGTDNPTTNLVVSGSGSNSEIYINRTDAAVPGLLNINSGSVTNNIYSTGIKDLTFATNNTERARITGFGSFGIGTNAPTVRLDVDGTIKIRSAQQLQFNNSDNTSGVSIQAENTTSVPGMTFNTYGAERMRIDSSGRLLGVGATNSIPTGSSTAGLQVHSTTSNNGAMLSIARFNNDSTGGKLVIGKSRSTTVAAGTIVQDNDAVGIIEFAADDGTDMSSRVAEIHAKVDGTVGVNSTPGRIEFRTTAAGDDSPTERLRITTEGDARFGLGASGSQPSSSNRGLWIRNDGHLLVSRGVNASGAVINAWGTLGEARIYGDGDLENTNNSYTGISDIRLKENISDATTQWDDIKSLRLVNFNFKEETNMSTHRQLGLIAQEVEEISPGLVKEREDHKSVNYSVVYLKAVKALQEAMDRIETLEARIAALESTD